MFADLSRRADATGWGEVGYTTMAHVNACRSPRPGRETQIPNQILVRRKAPKRGANPRARGAGPDSGFFSSLGDRILSVVNLIPRGQLFPLRTRKVLHYAGIGALAVPNTNLAVSHVFGLNGIYNIDITGGAGVGQPFEYAKAAAIWSEYNVIRCRGVVTVFCSNPVITFPVVVGIQLRGPNPNGLTLPAILARPGSQSQILQATGEARVVIPFDVYLPAAMGRSASEYKADYGAIFTTNPGGGGAGTPDLTCLFTVWACNEVGTAQTLEYTIRMEQTVEMFDLLL